MSLLRREGLVQNQQAEQKGIIPGSKTFHCAARKRVKTSPSHARIVQAGPAGPDEQWAIGFLDDPYRAGRRHPDFDKLPIYGIVQAPRSKWHMSFAWRVRLVRNSLKDYALQAGCRNRIKVDNWARI